MLGHRPCRALASPRSVEPDVRGAALALNRRSTGESLDESIHGARPASRGFRQRISYGASLSPWPRPSSTARSVSRKFSLVAAVDQGR